MAVDVGTSNTVVAYVDDAGTPQVCRIDDEVLVPSVLHRGADGTRSFGARALLDWAEPPQGGGEVFRRWKPLAGSGTTWGTAEVVGPEHLSAWLVEDVLAEIARGVGGRHADSVLLTVPHGWRDDPAERATTLRLAVARVQVAGGPLPVQPRTLSEPVAAAVYWSWAAHRDGDTAPDQPGGRLLVIDVGGGTTDFSLLGLPGPGVPMEVLAAEHIDHAGDDVAALLMAEVDRLFAGSERPARSPAELLRAAVEGGDVVLRAWFAAAEEMQRRLSAAISHARRSGRTATRTQRGLFESETGETVELSLTPARLEQVIAPFLERGREALEAFLRRQSAADLPTRVVLAGGGSRIAGVVPGFVEPAVRAVCGDEVAAAVGRLELSTERTDQAVALGAALVAAGVVEVVEYLHDDVGLQVGVDAELAAALALTGPTLGVGPVLQRGTPLPATVRVSDLGLPPLVTDAGSPTAVVVSRGGPGARELWSGTLTAGAAGSTGEPVDVDLELRVDADSGLTIAFVQDGETTSARVARSAALAVVEDVVLAPAEFAARFAHAQDGPL